MAIAGIRFQMVLHLSRGENFMVGFEIAAFIRSLAKPQIWMLKHPEKGLVTAKSEMR